MKNCLAGKPTTVLTKQEQQQLAMMENEVEDEFGGNPIETNSVPGKRGVILFGCLLGVCGSGF